MENKTLGDLIDDVGSRYLNRVAIYIDREKSTYHELMRSANDLAKGFLDIGIKKGDRICIWMGNCMEWLFCFFATSKIGAILVPINTRFKAEEARYVFEQAEPTTIILNDIYRNINFIDMIYELIPELYRSKPGKLNSIRFPFLKNMICYSRSEKRYTGIFDFAELLTFGRSTENHKLLEIQRKVSSEDVAIIQYTSGTTGYPKGAMLTHENFIKLGYHVGLRQELKESDRFFSVAPYFHCAGTLHAITTPLSFGCTIYSLERYEIEKAVEMIYNNKCNVYHGFNIFKDLIIEKNDLIKDYDLSCIERASTAGSPEELRQIYELGISGICHIYGLTETAGNATLCSPSDPLDIRFNTVGKSYPGVEICIRDPDVKNVTLSPNQAGEICIRGWNVMKGYYNKPEETRETFDEEGWLHSGDLGSFDNNGNLIFISRIKDIIRVGGENLSPIEVEDFLKRNPKVAEVCVIPVPDRRLGDVCMAFIRLKKEEKATEQEIIDYCRNKIANFKIPRYVRFIDEFPKTETNKIKRYEVKEIALKELA